MTDHPPTLAELVEQLAVRTTDGHGRDGDALLTQLAEARYSSLEHNGGGSSARSERVKLDLDAHMLWEDLSGRIQSIAADWTGRPATGEPRLDLTRWWASYTAADDRGEVKPYHRHAITGLLTDWVTRIHTQLDPKPAFPLRGAACPVCGYARVTIGEGELTTETDAIQITLGEQLEAECLVCFTRWVGIPQIVTLARAVGLDPDAAGVREALSDLLLHPDTGQQPRVVS